MEQHSEATDANELLWMERLVPIGREGNKVLPRTRRRGEKDTGETVKVRAGDRVVIPPGELVIDSLEIDEYSTEGPGGYAPVANTVWTWYRIVGAELSFLLFLFSLARRIDAAHALWALAISEHQNAKQQSGITQRLTLFNALARADVAIIALNRGFRMVYSLTEKFCPDLQVPASVRKIDEAVREMRNTLEHIDERAEGKGGPPGDAVRDAFTIFDQPEFLDSSILSYNDHSLNFADDVLAALLDCRELIMQAIDAEAESRARSKAEGEPTPSSNALTASLLSSSGDQAPPTPPSLSPGHE